MSDITREEAIKILKQRQCCRECVADCKCEDCDKTFETAIEALENQKTGHWINRHNIYANKTFDTKVCSECRYEYSYDAETGISNANFCPNCGAKMEGK